MTPSISRLVSTGSVLLDLVLDVPHLPDRGGDVLARPMLRQVSGGRNVMVAAARLDLPVAYAGPHGSGPVGDEVRAVLRHDGIEVLTTPHPDEDTGYCVTLVEPSGERTFVTVTGADAHADATRLAMVHPRGGDAVYVSGYDLAYPVSGPVVTQWVRELPRHTFVVVDPGPLVGQVDDELWRQILPRTGLLTLNDREAAHLPQLRRHLPTGSIVLHRLGAEGARVEPIGAAPTSVPGTPVEPLDTTGAGDTHTGALLAAVAHGLSWIDATAVANRAAAICVQRRGGATGPTLEELAAATPPADGWPGGARGR
jgi:sugar/nucleoside kinase (ribokinase family)